MVLIAEYRSLGIPSLDNAGKSSGCRPIFVKAQIEAPDSLNYRHEVAVVACAREQPVTRERSRLKRCTILISWTKFLWESYGAGLSGLGSRLAAMVACAAFAIQSDFLLSDTFTHLQHYAILTLKKYSCCRTLVYRILSADQDFDARSVLALSYLRTKSIPKTTSTNLKTPVPSNSLQFLIRS